MTRAALLLALLSACGPGTSIEPGTSVPLATPMASGVTSDAAASAAYAAPVRPGPRQLPPEAFLRAYLMWFGGLAPHDVQLRARNHDVISQWHDEIGALGLPDHAFDFPRATRSNAVMAAEIARLGEALCVLAAEHDLAGGKRPISTRTVFAFEPTPAPTREQFAPSFDVLHRTFLGYPLALAPSDRLDRFYALYQHVAGRHAAGHDLTADETAWVAVCTALVSHPEATIY